MAIPGVEASRIERMVSWLFPGLSPYLAAKCEHTVVQTESSAARSHLSLPPS